MTRGHLQRVFQPDGGLSTREEETYVYQGCSYFKVRVQFRAIGKASEMGSLNDIITSISQSFLEEPVYN